MSNGCGGCLYCDFPYEAQLPVKTDKGYETRLFESIDDIWDVIDLIIRETRELNKIEGNEFDLNSNIIAQIPFFACSNNLIDSNHSRMINQYVYCTDLGTPAYPGSFGEQPARWIQFFFIIKNALAKKQKKMYDEEKRKVKNG